MNVARRASGFTLIEILVAMAIFTLLSALAYGSLSRTIQSSEILSDRMNRLQSVQRTIRQLDQDFMQLAPRPVRKDLGDSYSPALQADSQLSTALELTRGGWSNPAARPRGSLQRVAYVVEDEQLLRYHWHVLDRTFSNEQRRMVRPVAAAETGCRAGSPPAAARGRGRAEPRQRR